MCIRDRLFAPAELARVSMFGTYTSLFCSVCYMGLDQALVRFFRETPGRMTPRALLTFCLSVALGFGVVSSAEMCIRDSSYPERWPRCLDLEDLIYRPALRLLIAVGYGVALVLDRLMAGVIVALRLSLIHI